MEKILYQTDQPYFTTAYLLSLFRSYKSPRDKIKNAVKNGDLIKVKQGFYILGLDYKRSFSKEVLSGMLYGPSAVSLEYALSFHGLIPERVERVTCLCFKKNKIFNTPVGCFSYKFISANKYSIGIEYRQTVLGNFFIAGPEKALSDKVYFSRITDRVGMEKYLFEELRIEPDALLKLDLSLLTRISEVYRRRNITFLLNTITKMQHKQGAVYA